MTVEFDDISRTWCVIGHDGGVLRQFRSNREAWAWVDAHEDDQGDEITHNRVRNAFREW